MKILSVRFTNLNSLLGSWTIDFTHPDYETTGIFAIVGATGAGKSTILDAISLALYGRTPRLAQISKSANEIMTRKTGECSAEVEFISAKGKFRCNWSQRRARRHPTGELQAPRHEIAHAVTNIPIENKIRDVARKVVEVTGMNFDQFTRSMLLAQGDFSKFLESSADERAPILEQITGTEIYSQISKKVHEITSSERHKLDLKRTELSQVSLLSEDEESELQTQLAVLRELTLNLQGALQHNNELRNWLLGILQLERSTADLESRAQALHVRIAGSEQARRRLMNGEMAKVLAPGFNHISELKHQQLADLQAFQTVQLQREELSGQLGQMRQQTEALMKQKSDAAQNMEESQGLLREVVRYDQMLQQQRTALSEQGKILQDLEKALQVQAERKIVMEQRKLRNKTVREDLAAFFQANQKQQKIIANFSGYVEQLKQLRELAGDLSQKAAISREILLQIKKTDEQIESRKQLVKRAAEDASNRKKQIEPILAEQKQLPPLAVLFKYQQSIREELQAMRDGIAVSSQLGEIKNKTAHCQQQNDKLQVMRQQHEEKIGAFTQEIALRENTLAKEEELLELHRKIAHLTAERQQLAEGQPCPLCGALSHPFVQSIHPREEDQAMDEGNLARSRQFLSACGESLAQERSSQAVTCERLARNRLDLAELLEQKTACERSLQVLQERYTWHSIAPGFLQARILEMEPLLSAAAKQIERMEHISKELEINRELIEQAETKKLVEQNSFDRLRQEVDHLRQNQARLETEQALAEKVHQAFLDNLRQELLCYDIPEICAENNAEVLKLLTNRRDKFLAAEKQQLEAVQMEEKIDIEMHHGEVTAKELGARRDEIKIAVATLQNEHRETAIKRTALFGDRDPEKAAFELQEALHRCEKLLMAHHDRRHDLEKKMAALEQQAGSLLVTTRLRQTTIQEKEILFAEQLRQSGFPSEQDFLAALLPDTELESLRTEMTALANEQLQNQAILQQARDALQHQRAMNLTSKTTEEIGEEITSQQNLLAKQQQETGVLQTRIATHLQAKEKYREKREQLQRMEKDFGYWYQLNTMIGSADGKKFRNFAQGITFQLMIHFANRHLSRMNNRYLLARNGEQPLDLYVIDNYQAGEIRSTANLSGGENFIVSLALALGLASMAGKNIRIDSLFLDEGFGTLDEEALETALETLAALQQEGKLIGIISHVPLLKERISLQLRLSAGPNGHSTIAGPGVIRA